MDETTTQSQSIDNKEDKIFEEVSVSGEDLKTLEEMMRVGLMYGHKKSKTNPKYKKYIYTTRNGIEIIDLAETLKSLEIAVAFLRRIMKDKGSILVVSTQPAFRDSINKFTDQFGMSKINERWIGGLLTNFKNISKRIDYFKKVRDDFGRGHFDKYTKKERTMINKNIERMKKMFIGLENMSKLPDAIFLIDASIKGHMTAIREARRLNIKIAGIIDSDDNPELIDYPIPANDHAKMSIDWILGKISESLRIGDQGDKTESVAIKDQG